MFKRFQEDIIDLVEPQTRVLDLGCGDGALIDALMKAKHVRAVGVDIVQDNVVSAVARGIPAIQGDIDAGLAAYPDHSFDYVILNQTLQEVYKPLYVLNEMVRVGKKAIVSTPNFAHWLLRLQILLDGKMPKNKTLTYEWYDTPNIHLASIRDVKDLCEHCGIHILDCLLYSSEHSRLPRPFSPLGNLLAEVAVFVLEKKPLH